MLELAENQTLSMIQANRDRMFLFLEYATANLFPYPLEREMRSASNAILRPGVTTLGASFASVGQAV
jgi:hypothetical protein